MQPIISTLRALGVFIWVYLDDFLLLADTKATMESNLEILLALLQNLGLEVNESKSTLVPSQKLGFLGFDLDLANACIRVPQLKLKSVLSDLSALGKEQTPSLRKVACVLGRVRSLAFALPHVRILTDIMVIHLKKLHGYQKTNF